MLANTISNSDELAVQEELEAMEKEELAKKIPDMPDVPKVIVSSSRERIHENKEDLDPVGSEEPQPILA